MNHYETLGVPKSAKPDAIKRAYRKRASKAHPDKGGNAEEMKSLNKAYAILSDDSLRSQYDATGEDPRERPEDEIILTMISEAFTAMLQQDVQRAHVAWCVGFLQARQNETIKTLKSMREALDHARGKLNDVERKGGGINLYRTILECEIKKIEAAIAEAETVSDMTNKAKARLRKEYADKPKTFTTLLYSAQFTGATTTTSGR
jgi:curved DNA-binding protein CbpA